MKNIIVHLGAALGLAFLSSGCTSFTAESARAVRVQEKSGTYVTLTPVQQKTITEGAIEVGYTGDMVYMALGKPVKVASKQFSEGPLEMWTYRIYLRPDPNPSTYVDPNYANTGGAQQPYIPAGSNGDSHALSRGGFASGPAAVDDDGDSYESSGVPSGLASTAGPLNQSLYLPDLPTEDIYVFLFKGRVFLIKKEADSPIEKKTGYGV